METREERDGPGRRGARRVFWPLVLILVGVIFLLDNLNLLPGTAGETLLNLWPLILVLIGVDGLLDGEGVAESAFVLGLGAALLLANLGYLALDTWQVVFTVWPVMVMAWGVDLITRRRAWPFALTGALLILAILAAAIGALSGRIPLAGLGRQPVEARQDFAGAQDGALSFALPVGVMRMTAGEDPARLTISHPAGAGEVVDDFSRDGNSAAYAWSAEPRTGMVFPFAGSGPLWEFRLPTGLPLAIQIEQGAAGSTFDLRGVELQDLQAEFGVGRMKVTLPPTAATVKISGGVGFLTVVVPQGVGVRIRRDTALAYFLAPEGFERQGDVYTSPGYATAETQIDLEIDLAVGGAQVALP